MKEKVSKNIIEKTYTDKKANNSINNTINRVESTSSKKLQLMMTTAILSALIIVTTAYVFHIPVPLTGGYIHVGDGIIYLAAALLPTPYAVIAAVIGGGMADLLTAPMWILPTMVIKALIVLPFSNKSTKIITKRNVIATIIALIISSTGYYFATTVIFGYQVAFITSLLGSLAQSIGSAIIFIIIGIALDNMKVKTRFMLNR